MGLAMIAGSICEVLAAVWSTASGCPIGAAGFFCLLSIEGMLARTIAARTECRRKHRLLG